MTPIRLIRSIRKTKSRPNRSNAAGFAAIGVGLCRSFSSLRRLLTGRRCGGSVLLGVRRSCLQFGCLPVGDANHRGRQRHAGTLGQPIRNVSWPSRETVADARVETDEIDADRHIEGPNKQATAHLLAKRRQGRGNRHARGDARRRQEGLDSRTGQWRRRPTAIPSASPNRQRPRDKSPRRRPPTSTSISQFCRRRAGRVKGI